MPQNTLVQLLYAAALGEESWDAFLDKLRDTEHVKSACLLTVSNAKLWARVKASSGFVPERIREFETHYFSFNPWLWPRIASPEFVLPNQALINIEDLIKTYYYEDYMHKYDVLFECSIKMRKTAKTSLAVSLQRPPEQSSWTTEDLRLLEYLAPHLQTAAKLQARLRAAKHIENLEVNAQHLIEQYDFTPAEVRLAGALFQGESVEIYAERTKTPINTVRWQIRRIYTKLDVHSQTELFPALARTISKFHDLG